MTIEAPYLEFGRRLFKLFDQRHQDFFSYFITLVGEVEAVFFEQIRG